MMKHQLKIAGMKLLKRCLVLGLALALLCTSTVYAEEAEITVVAEGTVTEDCGSDDAPEASVQTIATPESGASEADGLVSDDPAVQEISSADEPDIAEAAEDDESESISIEDTTCRDENPTEAEESSTVIGEGVQSSAISDDVQDENTESATEESTVVITEQEGSKTGSDAQPISSIAGTESGKTIQILSEEVGTITVSGTTYNTISFSFNCAEDDTEYEAYITGIKKIEYGEDYNDSFLLAMLSDVADSFYAEEPIVLSDSTDFYGKYKFTIAPIDAEKRDEKGEITDTQLCWAGSAADMLQYTGWNEQVGLTSEDISFDYFEQAFTDNGSSQEIGVKWFYNGIDTDQKVEEDGTVVYNDTELKDAQERLVVDGDQKVKTGNLLSEYAAETFTTHYEVKDNGISELYDAAMGLKDGKATGLGIFYRDDDGVNHGGHAITLFGYIKDAIETGINALKALFIADPDNSKFTNTDRSEMVDSVTMYSLTEWIGKNDGKDVTTVALKDYSTGYHTPILDFTVLEPYSADSRSKKETEGTKNTLTTMDYTPIFIEVDNGNAEQITEAEVLDEVRLYAGVRNVSYVKLDGTNNPYLTGKFSIYRNDQLIDTAIEDVILEGKALNPNATTYFWHEYRVESSGNYRVEFELDGIYYDDDNGEKVRIPEAYYNNNDYRFCYSFTAYPTGGNIDDDDYYDDDYVDDNTDNNPAVNHSYRESCIQYVPVNYASIDCEGAMIDKQDGIQGFTNMEVFKTSEGIGIRLGKIDKAVESLVVDGAVIDSKAYIVDTDYNGNTVIKLRSFYINSLLPGTYRIHVLDKQKNDIAMLEIKIR